MTSEKCEKKSSNGLVSQLSLEQRYSFAVLSASIASNPWQILAEEGIEEISEIDPITWQPKWYKTLMHLICCEILLLEEQIYNSVLPLWTASLPDNVVDARTNGKDGDEGRNLLSVCKNRTNEVSIKEVKEIDEIIVLAVVEQIILCSLVAFKGYDSRVRFFLRRLFFCLDIEVEVLISLESMISTKLKVATGNNDEESDKKLSKLKNQLKSLEAENEAELQNDPVKKLLKTEVTWEKPVTQGAPDNYDLVRAQIAQNEETPGQRRLRYAKVGLAAIIGGTLVGVTGGLAAPAVTAGIASLSTSLGLTSVYLTSFLTSTSSLAILTAVFASSGATLHGYKMSKRLSRLLSEFFFHTPKIEKCNSSEDQDLDVSSNSTNSMSLLIAIHGYLVNTEEFPLPNFLDSALSDSSYKGEMFYLVWERKLNENVGNSLQNFAKDQIFGMAVSQVIKNTALAAVMSAIAFPSYFMKFSNVIDNPWIMTVNKAKLCAVELAKIIMNEQYSGRKPVTLYAYSVGSLIVFNCLLELHKKKCFNKVENVYLIGSALVESPNAFRKARAVVAGRFVNCYSPKDFILGLLYKGSGVNLFSQVAGLNKVVDKRGQEFGIENVDLSKTLKVKLHYQYTSKEIHEKIFNYLQITSNEVEKGKIMSYQDDESDED